MGTESNKVDRGEPDPSNTIDVLRCLRCGHQGCTNVPSWGNTVGRPVLCSEHASPDMIQVVELRCQEPDCRSRRTYGFDGDAARFCATHKRDGMVDLMKRRTQCVMLNCTKLSTYGLEGFLARFCFSHKLQEMVYLKNRKRCEFYECTRQPTYGIDGKEAVFCLAHKEEGMTDVKNCRCKHPGCKRQPNYGLEGGRANYCSAHKLAQMINVVSRRCAFLGCKRQPIYGFDGAKAIFCPHHRLDTMVDVVNRQCEFNNCSKTPSYGYPGGRAQYCAHHHLEDMEDVKNRRCEWNECRRYPFFGNEGERSRFCSAHKEEGMVNIRTRKCEDDRCSKCPTHGFPGEKARACPGHVKPGMVYLKGCKSLTGLTGFRKYESAMSSLMGTGSPEMGSVGTHLSPDEITGTLGLLGGMQLRGSEGLRPELNGGWGMESRGAEVDEMVRSGGYQAHMCDRQEALGSNPVTGWDDARGMAHGSRGGGGHADALLSNNPCHGRDEVPASPQRQTMASRKLDLKGEGVEDGFAGRLREPCELQDPRAQGIRSIESTNGHLRPQTLRPKDEHDRDAYEGSEYQRPSPPFSHSKQHLSVLQHPESCSQVEMGRERMFSRPTTFDMSRQDAQTELHGYREEQDYRCRQDQYEEPRAKVSSHNGPLPHLKGNQSYDFDLYDEVVGAPMASEPPARSALRPLQPRVTAMQSYARRSTSSSLNRSDNAVPGSGPEGMTEGGRRGGGVSPFVGQQASPHFRLSSIPPMLSGSFPSGFHLLDRDNPLGRDDYSLGGTTGNGAGEFDGDGRGSVAAGEGGRGGRWGRDYGMSTSQVDNGYPARDATRFNGAVKADTIGEGVPRGGTRADSSSPPMNNTGFGSRLSGVDLGSGLVPPINRMHDVGDGRDSSPGSFHNISQETSVSSVPGERSSISSASGYIDDSTAVVVPARSLSPPMTVLGDSGESPPGLPRISTVDNRVNSFNASVSESSQHLSGSSAPFMSNGLLEHGGNIPSTMMATGSHRGSLRFASAEDQRGERLSRTVESEDAPAEAPEAPSDFDDYNGAVFRGQKVSLSGGMIQGGSSSEHDAMGPSASGGGQEADADTRKRFRIEELLH